MEIWKEVIDYSNYEVSNLGNVRRKKDNHILRTEQNHKGYLRVDLSKDGTRKHFKVHRLVAQAFIPNPDNLPQINHKDMNKQNNNVENLEWCDNWYNTHYRIGANNG